MKFCNQVILTDIIFFSSGNGEHNTAIRKTRHNKFNTSPQKYNKKSDQNDSYTFQLKIEQMLNTLLT